MKLRLIFSISIFILTLCSVAAWAQTGFDRAAYYAAFAKSEAAGIEMQLAKVALLNATDREAFEGALLMRKAGLQSSVVQKLSFFKQGGKALEAAIKANPQNVEYRFLRLMIQENAPKIVGYNDNLKEDSELVKKNIKLLPVATQKAVQNYAKVSKYL